MSVAVQFNKYFDIQAQTHQYTARFIEVFGMEKVIFVDGTNMGYNEAGYLDFKSWRRDWL